MSDNDPAYKGECTDSVADYNYEFAMLQNREAPPPADEMPPSVQRERANLMGRTLGVIGVILAVVLVGGLLVSNDEQQRDSAESATTPAWQDSAREYPPANPTPWPIQTLDPLPPPLETPDPLPSPPGTGPPALSPVPQSMCDTRVDVPSYQAVPVEGPFTVLPGWYWVAGPEDRPTRAVLHYRIGQWWNWKLIYGTDNCHDFVLEPWRQK